MQATHLEPVTPQQRVSPYARKVLILRTRRARLRRAGWIAVSLALAGAAVIAAGFAWRGQSAFFPATDPQTGPVERLVMPTEAADLSIILETEVMPLTAEDARAQNEQRPLDMATVAPARPFRVTAGNDTANQFDAALRCLTQAIYYEAASEPEAGQRAVAQVVLNRVKHLAFPNTICGVVYQGSQRVTGCQFTFTCDGSLARTPLPALYRRAEKIAREAMSGRVAPEVGNSTNYHADYVVPYWAASLDKLAQIGRHIFYGLRGAIGYRSAFRMHYDVALEIPPAPALLATPGLESVALPDPLIVPPGALASVTGTQLTEDTRSGSLISGASASAVEAIVPSPLRADQEGGLLIDPGSRLDEANAGTNPPANEPR